VTRFPALETQLLATVRARHLLRRGDVVLCAVSGGADSMALLWTLYHQRERLGIELEVAHVHHGLPEARSDEALTCVQAASERLGLRCHVLRSDVPRLMRRNNCSVETAGRIIRLRWFRKLIERDARRRIATAHTADDQAETVLLRMLRGCGVRALGGIQPGFSFRALAEAVAGPHVVRPLLDCPRAETRAYLALQDIDIVEDPTNADTTFSRNRVRHLLLPLLAEQFNPRVVQALCRLADLAREDARFIDSEAEQAAARVVQPDRLGMKVLQDIADVPMALARRIWSSLLDEPLSMEHVERLQHLARGHAGRRLTLGGGLEARREYDGVRLEPASEALAAPPLEPIAIEPPAILDVAGWHVELAAVPPHTPSPGRTLLVDAEQLAAAGPLMLRTRRDGDRWMPPGGTRLRKLKATFNAWRIPPAERDGILLLIAGDSIAAILGWATDERFRPRPESARLLAVHVSKSEADHG
jgi:tRNA(Ile)-lysidine synthase